MAAVDRHIAIVGGGVIGLACAFRLATAGLRVTLLERDRVGAGATLASLGALWPSRPSIRGLLQDVQRASLWQLEVFVRQVEHAAGVPVRFTRAGHLELLTSPRAVDDARRDAASCGDWPTFGHPHAMDVLEPGQGLPPGVIGTSLGTLQSHVTAQIDVPDYVLALRRAAESAGAVVRENTEAEITVEGGGATVTAGDALASDAILVAAGAWTAQFHPVLAAAAPTRPVKGQAIEVEALHPVPQLIVRRDKVYLVPWGRRVFIGSTTEKDAGFDTSVNEAAVGGLLRSAREFCPALEGAGMVRAWAGLRPDAPRHRPIMGQVPGVKNLFVCAGHFKTGIGLSALVSQMMAELLLNPATPPAALTPFAPRAG